MRKLLLDAAPLRASGPFRRLLLGRTISMFGSQVTVVAVMYQVWEMTGSPAWSGSVAVAQALPMIVVGLWGGALLDRVDRRRVLVVATIGQLCCTGVLVIQAVWCPSVGSCWPPWPGRRASWPSADRRRGRSCRACCPGPRWRVGSR